jgi:hypothetical protein
MHWLRYFSTYNYGSFHQSAKKNTNLIEDARCILPPGGNRFRKCFIKGAYLPSSRQLSINVSPTCQPTHIVVVTIQVRDAHQGKFSKCGKNPSTIQGIWICEKTCMSDSMALSFATAMVMPRGLKLACSYNNQ